MSAIGFSSGWACGEDPIDTFIYRYTIYTAKPKSALWLNHI